MAAHTIYVLSGGAGASGEQLVHTVLAQFEPGGLNQGPAADALRPTVVLLPGLRLPEQVDAAIERAAAAPSTLLLTLVEPGLRRYALAAARRRSLAVFDLMGPLIEHLETTLERPALGEPGLYRRLNKAYFDRVAAINFAMAHDDGQRPEGLTQADIVLLGVSRVGKTPLSMYLAVLGWKTANVPIVPELEPPAEIDRLDRGRAFGLTIEPAELARLRSVRSRAMGAPGLGNYTDPEAIYAELSAAEALFKRRGFTLLDVTNRPLESNADEILRRLGSRPSRAAV